MSDIPREEWDFSKCPKDQIEGCHFYEFTRESNDRRREVERFRRAFPIATFDEYMRRFACDELGALSLVEVFPEFPNTPFMAIPVKERIRRFKKLPGIEPVPCESPASFAEFFSNLCEEFDLNKVKGMSHHGKPYTNFGDVIKCPGVTYAAFRFEWDASDELLIGEFRQWLCDNRDQSIPIKEKRGKGNETARLKLELKLLGTWRLLNRMTWEGAYELTREHLKKGLWCDRAEVWARQFKAAERLLSIHTVKESD